ncbi:hypothetical protein DPMN_016386 [Dreissena polymorpha]|uniref:Uncharacterized protein n=1 Tax=Dreissena polymorpha TaxID=45954 RepID=A0A9D4NDF1_DREPO|nr:hypothetical protein DPMN_016386 [Dreissena polymorpha]
MLAAASSLIASDWCPAQHSFHFSLFGPPPILGAIWSHPRQKRQTQTDQKTPSRRHRGALTLRGNQEPLHSSGW